MPAPDLSAAHIPVSKRIPEPYLRAEIAAFPLVSEESFRIAILELESRPNTGLNTINDSNKTQKLWRACENQLAEHTGWSLDRLVSARDHGWFGAEGKHQNITLYKYLQNLAQSYLVKRAGVTEIEENTELSALDTAIHYRWLTLTIPEDLLLSALGVEPAPRLVDIDPPLLVRRLLDQGVAEIHQHIGAGMDFTLLWVSALAAIVTPEVGEFDLASPGAPLAEGKPLVRWLLVAAIARSAIAEFLIRGSGNFKGFICAEFLNDPQNPEAHLAWTSRRSEILVSVFEAVASGDDKRLPEIQPLRDLYTLIHPTALALRDNPLTSVADAYKRCDPIAVRMDLHGENAGERWFLRQAFAYFEDDKSKNDHFFTCIFWQTIRVRCQYYHAVVERPLTGGLQWFLRFYDRLGTLRKPIEPIMPQVSYRVAGGCDHHRIKALEIRTSMGNSAIEIGEFVLSSLKSWERILNDAPSLGFEPEFGIIFHFLKLRDDNKSWAEGKPAAFWAETHAEPVKNRGNDVEHGRYVGYFSSQCTKARALVTLIREVPSCLWVIRGLDVATDELSIPNWVLTPLFRHVLDEAAKASILEGAGPPLRLTAHVGEDFRHLLEGMRHIYEQIHYILGNTPGRLGHAIALGVEPQAWAESVGSILMPAEERLWDLVWEWRLYSKYRINPEYAAIAPEGRIASLLNKVTELSEHVHKTQTYNIEELAEAHHTLHRCLVPPHTREPVIEGRFNTFRSVALDIKEGRQERVRFHEKVGEILKAYFDDESTFQRGQALIDVPICKDEVAALNAIQYALRCGVAQNGIVIEVNPSSNLFTGDLLDLRSHPILRLFPPEPEPEGPPPVAIALGSDDPIIFSTQLLREYTFLHQAACTAGYSERVVQEWLELIRRNGMDARFTRAWKPNAQKKIKELISDLSRYLHIPDD